MSSFNADETVTIFEIFGIPPAGIGLVTTSLTHIPPVLAQTWSPTYSEGNFQSLVERVWARLQAASPAIVTRVRVHLNRWDTIGATNPLMLTGGSGGEMGVVVNYPAEREIIRQTVGNLLGISVPQGGFTSEMNRKLSDINFSSGDR